MNGTRVVVIGADSASFGLGTLATLLRSPILRGSTLTEVAVQSLAVDAAVRGDRDLALQALLLDPMIDDIDRARAILDDYLTVHADYLPRFHGRWLWDTARAANTESRG